MILFLEDINDQKSNFVEINDLSPYKIPVKLDNLIAGRVTFK